MQTSQGYPNNFEVWGDPLDGNRTTAHLSREILSILFLKSFLKSVADLPVQAGCILADFSRRK